MKNIFYLLVLIIFVSCKKEVKIENPKMDLVSFVGTWTRSFDVIGAEHVAKYTISKSEIQYSLSGLHNAKYTLALDSYNAKDSGRWIGHTKDNQYYLLFFKGVLEENITLYKQKIDNPNTGLEIKVPAEDTEENYGWNTYILE